MARLTADHLTFPARKWPQEELHIGISGWTYPPWRGVFYPKKLPHRLELECNFDNDAKVHAPFNAKTLAQKLKLQGAAI